MDYRKKINFVLFFTLLSPSLSIPIPVETPTPSQVEKTRDFLNAGFASIVETAMKSVVTVDVAGTVDLSGDCDMMSTQTLEQMMFSDVFPKPLKRRILSGGTGFVVQSVNAQGQSIPVIVTNHHVVESALQGQGSISVSFANGKKFPAKIIAVDSLTDLAVLSIESKESIPALQWGKSAVLKAGHFAIAIGSPGIQGIERGNRTSLTLDFSVTHGIISNAQRIVPEAASSHNITHFIQTDAAINPGNSGGPLLNTAGEVIGINTMGYGRLMGYQAMNMAIPSDLARPIVDKLAKGQSVSRGYLGIQIGDAISQSLSKHLGMPNSKGVMIDAVFPDTPADRGGLRAGDVILRINGVETLNHQQARALTGAIPPGQNLAISLWRGSKDHRSKQEGREIDLLVVVGRFPSELTPKPSSEGVLMVPELGISFRYYTGIALGRLGLNLGGSAVMVDSIKSAPEIQDTLLPGDVIKEINGQPVGSLAEVSRLLQFCIQSGHPSIMVLIMRQANGGFRPIHKVLWTSPGFGTGDVVSPSSDAPKS